MWISYFGAAKRSLSDNECVCGGWFNNEGFRQMNKKLNFEICATAAESPLSNGTVERHNLIVTKATENTLEDEKCELEITLDC